MTQPFGEAPSTVHSRDTVMSALGKNLDDEHRGLFVDLEVAVSSMVENFAPDFDGTRGRASTIATVRRMKLSKEEEVEHIMDALIEKGFITPSKLQKALVRLSKKYKQGSNL